MLEMRAVAAVGGNGRPLVAEDARFRLTRVHHRLNGEHHTFAKAGAVTACPIIWNLRFLVQTCPDAVADKLTHYAEAVVLDVFLNRGANIAYGIADAGSFNPAVQRSLGHFQKLLQLGSDLGTH